MKSYQGEAQFILITNKKPNSLLCHMSLQIRRQLEKIELNELCISKCFGKNRKAKYVAVGEACMAIIILSSSRLENVNL